MVGEARQAPANGRPVRCLPRSNSISAALAFGRGYGSAEISGDNGIAGSLELRFDQKLNYRYWSGYQLYSFVDCGSGLERRL